ncbi:putative Alcohol dehydrogenase zinc-binding domain protein [Bradyrhizobium sp. STM 3843]|uniref:quinone oxidoreductase family protein n=1 Tax=Bradyrhizobium sp. STM 3843 TaxID=551947 RepID=UPI000240467E|nr:NAD(P)-dependent alcohol dehydrogenase [Bradyrhizobium sp. STM 3843]CCE09236.1 putative Alcohol dehydrogenase zinc-binding domain protein [Bradyrhizobium sp. STM 3843]
MSDDAVAAADHFRAIGYTRAPDGLPLETFERPVPKPQPGELLVHVVSSSLNPLDYKLAELNFLGRTPPVALGFDFAGIVIARGDAVTTFDIGDAVFGMVPSNRDGAWASGGTGGYALVPECLVTSKPDGFSFVEAGALGVCYLSAYLALADTLDAGATVYIPGGGGGVGHLAIQLAKALGAKRIISSAGNVRSRALALSSGADHVFDYRRDDIEGKIDRLTQAQGVDLVFDATYSEDSFVATSKLVRPGGRWVVLGVGPGKTSRRAETESPVAGILAAKDAQLVNVNLLRYFSDSVPLDAKTKTLLSGAIRDAAATAEAGVVRPHLSEIIPSEVGAINAALAEMRAGRKSVGKIAIVVDKERAR